MKDVAKYAGGGLLTVLLLWWVLHGVEFSALAESWGNVRPLWLAAAAIVMHGHTVIRVWRWGDLLRPIRRGVPFRPMFSAVILGYVASWVVPGRVGEVVRPALLSARERLPLGPALGTVVADRLMDGAAIVILFAVGAFLTPLAGDAAAYAVEIRTGALALLGILTVGLAVLLLVNIYQGELTERVRGRHGPIAWSIRSLLSVARGTESLRHPILLPKILLQSVAMWFVIELGTWIGIRGAGIDIGLGAVMLMMPMLAFGVALPTPGGVGGYHAMMKAGLVYLFAVPEAAAVNAGIVVHLVVVVPILLLGVVLLWTERLSWRDLLAAARGVRELGSEPGEVAPSRRAVEDVP